MERVISNTIINMILPYSNCCILKVWRLFDIQNQKKYYNQKAIIDEINKKTKYPIYEVAKILNSLSDIVKDKFSDNDTHVEIKLFKGLKISSKIIPTEESVSKRLGDFINSNTSMIISANFSDSFRKEINKKRKNKENFTY